ncbi:hypothetical protein [Rhizobium phage RHph_X2_24]|nr:hypothetical protein [Rhizobium phage RHph_X2_24]
MTNRTALERKAAFAQREAQWAHKMAIFIRENVDQGANRQLIASSERTARIWRDRATDLLMQLLPD